MKLSHDKLKQLVAEELEQEGFLDTMKGKLAPGMVVKQLASSYPVRLVNGVVDFNPEMFVVDSVNPIGGFNRLNSFIKEIFQDERFTSLPEDAKTLMNVYLEKISKQMTAIKNTGGDVQQIKGLFSKLPAGGLKDIVNNIGKKKTAADAERSAAEREREDRRNREKNEFETAKDSALRQKSDQQSAALEKDPNYLAKMANVKRAREYSDEEASSRPSAAGHWGSSLFGVTKKNESKNMKLTKEKLKEIIKEELEQILKEQKASK